MSDERLNELQRRSDEAKRALLEKVTDIIEAKREKTKPEGSPVLPDLPAGWEGWFKTGALTTRYIARIGMHGVMVEHIGFDLTVHVIRFRAERWVMSDTDRRPVNVYDLVSSIETIEAGVMAAQALKAQAR